MSAKRVWLFKEGNADMRNLLGGKGANLAEMTNLGLPVPPGLTITTETCMDYINHGNKMPTGLMNEVREALVYNAMSKWQAAKDPENKRKLNLYDSFQAQINNATTKKEKNALERKFTHLLHTNKDYRYGKGLKELSSIASTVFILALCAPILSQIILHPVMDLIFGKKKENKTKA